MKIYMCCFYKVNTDYMFCCTGQWSIIIFLIIIFLAFIFKQPVCYSVYMSNIFSMKSTLCINSEPWLTKLWRWCIFSFWINLIFFFKLRFEYLEWFIHFISKNTANLSTRLKWFPQGAIIFLSKWFSDLHFELLFHSNQVYIQHNLAHWSLVLVCKLSKKMFSP